MKVFTSPDSEEYDPLKQDFVTLTLIEVEFFKIRCLVRVPTAYLGLLLR